MLAGILVIISLLISFTIIIVDSNLVKPPLKDVFADIPPQETAEPEINTDKLSHSANNDIQTEQKPPTASNTTPAVDKKPAATVTPAAPPARTAPAGSDNVTVSFTAQRHAEKQGTLVFVIDDAGNNLQELEPFLRIPHPLTIAVLPGLPYSAEAARRIRAAGKEVILHQPMEALGGQNPGPGAIYSNMTADEIKRILARNIAEIGPVTGMNNHQGSKITMDGKIMEVVLSFCAEQKIYFLDSRTTADTVAPAVARDLGIKYTERDVFIDNEQNKDAMLNYINNGLARAQRNGNAVMIGHTWSPELAPILAELFPKLEKEGYTLKTASSILK